MNRRWPRIVTEAHLSSMRFCHQDFVQWGGALQWLGVCSESLAAWQQPAAAEHWNDASATVTPSRSHCRSSSVNQSPSLAAALAMSPVHILHIGAKICRNCILVIFGLSQEEMIFSLMTSWGDDKFRLGNFRCEHRIFLQNFETMNLW